MKAFCLTYILILGTLIFQNTLIYGQEQPYQSEHKEWIFSSKVYDGIELHNQHGNVTINAHDNDTLQVKVSLIVKTKNQTLAQEVFDQINISSTETDGKVYFRTSFADNFYSNFPFEINYEIFIPSGQQQVIVNNQFGDITLNAPVPTFEPTLRYGRLVQNKLATIDTINGDLAFSNVQLIDAASCNLKLDNANVNIQRVDNGLFSGQFFQLNINKINRADIKGNTSRLNISESGQITIKSNFCFATIGKIQEKGQIEISNGFLIIENVSHQLKELSIANNGTPITLTLPESLSYTIQGEITNGDFFHFAQQALRIISDQEKTFFSGTFNENGQPASIVVFNKNAGINIKELK